MRTILAALVVIAILGAYLLFAMKVGRIQIDNSLVEAPAINVVPTAPGKLTDLPVNEGQIVAKGDALATVGSNTIRADTDSQVIAINQDEGSSVGPAAPIMQLINPNHLRVDGTIDENKGLDQIKVGQVASFTVDAFPSQKFWGYVDEISPSAKATQLSFSISSERPTQQFSVYVRFDSHKYPQLKNGMSAKITVYTSTF